MDTRSLMLLGIACLGACAYCHAAGEGASKQSRTIRYHGIRPTDPGGMQGLRNPERGYRIETRFAEFPGTDTWGPAHHLAGRATPHYSDDWWLMDMRRFETDGLTIAQTYCYLDDYVDAPIPQARLDRLEESFAKMREAGGKCLLRFAYETTTDRDKGPDLERILGHMEQLVPIIRANSDVIFVMQAGFVGAWGEWHSSAKGLEKDHHALARIIAKVLGVLPQDRMTQVRVPKYKRWVLEDPAIGAMVEVDADNAFSGVPAARIGFNNDGFLANKTCGGTWPEPPLYSSPGNPEFDYMTRESAFVPVDGELFWSDQGGVIEGLRAAVRLRLHHYCTFSIAHSYSEREGKPFSIDGWKTRMLSRADIEKQKMPASDGYFEDGAGNAVSRSAYDYIRDHLGYRLELQEASFAAVIEPGKEQPVKVALVNRGFSTLFNPRPVFLVLIGEGGTIDAMERVQADPREWQPYASGDETFTPFTHVFEGVLRVPAELKRGGYMVGLWMPDASERLRDDGRYAVRVANRDVPWWTKPSGAFGVNILGAVTVRHTAP